MNCQMITQWTSPTLAYSGSIAFKKSAKHPGRIDQIRAAFQMAGRLAIEILSVEHLEVIGLAAQTGLTTYDACYLWLARKTGGELVTLDKHLLEASAG